MEEEDLCSSLPEETNPDLFEESWTSTDHQYLNGEPEQQKESVISQELEPQGGIVYQNEGRETPEETEAWEQIIWTGCTTTSLSMATVQWDMPEPSLETRELVTDSVLANETDSGTLSHADNTSFPIGSENVQMFKEAESEEQDEFDSWLLLCSESEWMGHHLKPCDSESKRAQTTQEVEHLTHKLLDSNYGISLRPSESVETDFTQSCVEINFTDFIEDSIQHLGEPDVADNLLSGQIESEEEPTLVNGDAIAAEEEEEEEEVQVEEEIVTEEEAPAACHLRIAAEVEFPQSEENGLLINPDKLIDLQQLIEDLSQPGNTVAEADTYSQRLLLSSKDSDMCKDINQDMKPEQSDEGVQTGVSEVTKEAAENTEEIDSLNLQEDWCGTKLDKTITANGHFEHTNSSQIQIPQEQSENVDLPPPDVVQMTKTCHSTPYEMLAELKISTEKSHDEPLLEEAATAEDEVRRTIVANGHQCMNGGGLDREEICQLADRLFKLDGIQRVDVVKHLDKDNSFSRAVGEEYLKYFAFSGQTLDQALRSFLNVVVLIGETQERERVLQHFSNRFFECNPDTFSSSGAVLALTCAMMLLNTDLHGQHVGKSMSSSKFVSNLDTMNDGENFNKDLLKSIYSSIKAEPLQWALDEEELKSSVLPEEDTGEDAPLRSKANPFLDVPHDRKAIVIKQGFLQRKLHADIDGKRTPWGKRGWKIFNAVLRGMVLFFQKDDYRKEQQMNEEVVSVHHSLAEEASDYTKKPHVFRLQTADWRVFLFQASSKAEMNSWMNRINLVSALHSAPPFPAAVGSQRRFCRPILPASQSANTLDHQLQSHLGMLESFRADLSHLHQNPPEGRRAKAKDLEEQRVRAEYLQHEICRYEAYIQVLEAWRSVSDDGSLNTADLNQFDKALCGDASDEEEEEECGLKKSHSSPSLELEVAAPSVVKVRRNISERRTYRKVIIPRWNKEV